MLAGAGPVGTELVALEASLARVLASDVISTVALPPRDNASMDGFAMRAEDMRTASDAVTVRLRVIETTPAGTLPTRTIARGEASRIMTGAYVPLGADSVIRVED